VKITLSVKYLKNRQEKYPGRIPKSISLNHTSAEQLEAIAKDLNLSESAVVRLLISYHYKTSNNLGTLLEHEPRQLREQPRMEGP
jgi:hypothetical protein